jgi:dihydroneopterin aldolase
VPATLSIVDLKLSCHLGVPDAERRKPQTVLCSAWFPVLHMASAARADDLRKTVDYHSLSKVLQGEARRTPRKLLERLATDLARVACHRFSLPWVEIELKKFILPQTRHVSLRARFSKKELL